MDERKIEEKLEELSRQVEDKMREIGESVDSKFKQHLEDKELREHIHSRSRRGGEFWGVILLVVGFLILADNMHWFNWDIPLIPLGMIILGVYLIFLK